MRKKNQTKYHDPNETKICKWSTCALSHETLKPPYAIDRLGNVFNKESLVRALLEKNFPNQFRHIRGLKDIITIKLDPIRVSGFTMMVMIPSLSAPSPALNSMENISFLRSNDVGMCSMPKY